MQPAPEDRIEVALASLHATYFNRTRQKSEAAKSMKDYLPFLDPWPEPTEYSDTDLQSMRALGLKV